MEEWVRASIYLESIFLSENLKSTRSSEVTFDDLFDLECGIHQEKRPTAVGYDRRLICQYIYTGM